MVAALADRARGMVSDDDVERSADRRNGICAFPGPEVAAGVDRLLTEAA